MNQIRLDLSHIPVRGFIDLGMRVHAALTGNPNVPAPDPALPELQTLLDAAKAKLDDYNIEKEVLHFKMLERDSALQALGEALRREALTVETVTGGDAGKIGTTGFELKTRRSRLGQPEQVLGLLLTADVAEGTLGARWKAVRGVRSYEIEINPDFPSDTGWRLSQMATRSKAKLKNLTSRTRAWVRVRAVGAAGPGPWSDPMAKTVP